MTMQRFTLALLLLLTGQLWAINPTVTITPISGSSATSPITFTITFDQPISGLTVGKLTVGNGTITNLAQVTSGTYSAQWLATVTPTAQGAVTLLVPTSVVQNAASEPNQQSNTATVTYDTAPVATISITTASLSGVTFSIHFDQVWSISDVSKITVAGASITSQATVTATPFNTYDLQVVPYGNGTVSLHVGAGAFVDSGTLTNAAVTGTVTVGTASTGTEARVTSLTFLSAVDRSYSTGDAIDLDVVFSRPVTVQGLPVGAPALALNATGSASTASSAAYLSTTGSHVTLRYTVLAGHYTSALDAVSTSALTLGNAGGIVGDDNFLAILTLPSPGSSTSLRGSGAVGVNYTPPKPPVDSVAGSDTTSSCGLGSGVGLMLGSFLAGMALVRRRR
jgi:hypothetical protein